MDDERESLKNELKIYFNSLLKIKKAKSKLLFVKEIKETLENSRIMEDIISDVDSLMCHANVPSFNDYIKLPYGDAFIMGAVSRRFGAQIKLNLRFSQG